MEFFLKKVENEPSKKPKERENKLDSFELIKF